MILLIVVGVALYPSLLWAELKSSYSFLVEIIIEKALNFKVDL